MDGGLIFFCVITGITCLIGWVEVIKDIIKDIKKNKNN